MAWQKFALLDLKHCSLPSLKNISWDQITLHKSSTAQCGNHTVWKSRQKYDHHFYLNIDIFSVKPTFLITKLLKSWFHGIFFFAWSHFSAFFHTVNHEYFLLHYFGKNFVKATVLLIRKLLKSWFHEIFFGEREFLAFPQCARE